MTRIAIIGAGHVGVVYAAGLAELGHTVRVVDIDRRRIANLQRGKLWFYETGLPELLGRGLKRGRIEFTLSYATALKGAHFVFVCVPTPTGSQGSLDDSYLRAAYDLIRDEASTPLPIIVNKSTVPVGTGDTLARIFDDQMRVVSNPEFLAEGRAVEDFFHPARILLGSHDRGAAEAVARLYAPLHARVVYTDPISAELSKLAANAFLAMKVSFANALSAIGDAIGANGEGVTQALSADPRIGAGHLRAGLGFGGSCLPKDLAAVEHLARTHGAASELFRAVAAVNRGQRTRIVDVLISRLGSLSDRRIAILGASYKANTDDLRDSPSLMLAEELAELNASVVVHDPVAAPQLRARRSGLSVSRSAISAARAADALIIATEWPEFGALDLGALKRTMRGSLLIDARGILDSDEVRRHGFDLFNFGGGRLT